MITKWANLKEFSRRLQKAVMDYNEGDAWPNWRTDYKAAWQSNLKQVEAGAIRTIYGGYRGNNFNPDEFNHVNRWHIELAVDIHTGWGSFQIKRLKALPSDWDINFSISFDDSSGGSGLQAQLSDLFNSDVATYVVSPQNTPLCLEPFG